MKHARPTSVVTNAPWANKFGSNESRLSAMKAALTPNISLVARKTINAVRMVSIEAAVRVRARIFSASFW